MNQNLKIFLDPIGRIILGNVVSETDTDLSVENPALIHIQPNPQNGQLQLQMIPLFFKELLAQSANSPVFSYSKQRICQMNDTQFADQFINQYNQIANPSAAPKQQPATPGPVVQLFDEKQ